MTKIKRLRIDNGLSQKQLAIVMDVSQPTASAWESGVKFPTGDKLKKLAAVFRTTVDELLGDEPDYQLDTENDNSEISANQALGGIYMRNAQDLYDLIIALLNERNIEQTKMMLDLGLIETFLISIKKGTMPRSDYLAMIAKYLGVTCDYLLGYTDDPQKKELLSDEKAILSIREIFINNGTLKPGEPIHDWQIRATREFLTCNAEILRKLANEYR